MSLSEKIVILWRERSGVSSHCAPIETGTDEMDIEDTGSSIPKLSSANMAR
jgi:hypothetical protein